jgi:hypothetical protein
VKPTTFDELVETMRSLESYWSKAMKLRPGLESTSPAPAAGSQPIL